MPYDIRTLESPTHPIKIKRTASKATVALADGCTRLDDGFQLQIGLAEIHVPRMWVERHPHKKDSQVNHSLIVIYYLYITTHTQKFH